MTTFKNNCGCIIRTENPQDTVDCIKERMGEGWEIVEEQKE